MKLFIALSCIDKTSPMKKSFFFLLLIPLLLFSCKSRSVRKNTNSSPEIVVQKLFQAAQSNNPMLLKGLCSPEIENDGDTDCLCALYSGYTPDQDCSEQAGNWDKYVQYFRKGKLNGKARIDGDQAAVDFYFGFNGDRTETMHLQKLKGKWYLSGF